ncbi:MAG TPA: hypothetical protein VHG89_12805 [Verrucomicrobiae bacterium]|nr:hypothetical protein [Verrucomicrobiae bacterium]
MNGFIVPKKIASRKENVAPAREKWPPGLTPVKSAANFSALAAKRASVSDERFVR